MKNNCSDKIFYIVLLVIWLPLLLCKCAHENVESISSVRIGKNEVKVFNLTNVKDSIDIKLSDLVDDIAFIPLETNPNCLLNRPDFFIGPDYILSFEKGGSIYQFDRAGNFIRPITNYGQGPVEVSQYVWAVDESANILYVKNQGQENFLSFDLKSGEYLKKIPLAHKCEIAQFVVPQPGTFLIAPTLSPAQGSNSFFSFWQNSNGDFLGGVPAPADSRVGYGSQVLYQVSDETYYYYSKTDTLFSIDKKSRSPEWIFNLSTVDSESKSDPGSKTLNVIVYHKKYMLCSLFIARSTNKKETITATTGGLFYLLFDNKKKQAKYLNRLTVDILEQPVRPVLIKTQHDGTVYIRYNALDFKEQIEQTLLDPDIDPETRENLEKLNTQIAVEDNPILLVGKVRS